MEWRFATMNLHELVRRFQAGETRNAISRAMDLSVNTVTAYRRWAETQKGAIVDFGELQGIPRQTGTTPDRLSRIPALHLACLQVNGCEDPVGCVLRCGGYDEQRIQKRRGGRCLRHDHAASGPAGAGRTNVGRPAPAHVGERPHAE